MSRQLSRPFWVAVISVVPLCASIPQTYLGDYTGYDVAGRAVNVHAGQADVRFIFYATDIVRVDFLPLTGSVPDSSLVVIRDTSDAVAVSISETDSTLTLTSSSLRVLCRKYPLRMSYLDGAGVPLLAEPESGGLATVGSSRAANFVLHSSDHFYGTGERGIGLDLVGRSFDSYNTAAYGYGSALSTMNTNVPFLASTNGYALYFDNTYPGSFDLGASDQGKFAYVAAGGELTMYVIAAPSVQDELERYTWLTGRQPLPPRWAFGYLQSKFGYRNETEARAMVQTMRQKQIPCDAIILDLYWYDKMGDLTWNTTNFPDPFQMMSDFLAAGFKTIAITEPYIINSSPNWAEASAGGYLATDSNGTSYLLPNWWSCNCPASLLDITNPSARSWWWGKHPAFFGAGLAGIWTDLGEPERHPDDMKHVLGTASKVHNVYDLLWAQADFEGFNAFRPDRRLFNLTRSGFAGIQRYGVVPWSGDVRKSFGGLAVQLPMLLNMGMSGLAYHNSDIGGFCCGTTTAELYVRWMEYGTFCPIARAHGAGPAVGGQDTEPWAFGAAAESIATKYIRLRYELLPYTYTMAHENYASGMPLARPLLFEQPDANTFNESSSYLWGDAFLVSPVVEAGQSSKTVYLPAGTWYDYWTDVQYTGGQAVTVSAPLDVLPLFVRGGSIVPMQSVMNFSDERPLDTLTLSIYPLRDQPAAFTLYEDDGYTLRYQTGQYAETVVEEHLSGSDSVPSLHLTIGPAVGSYEGKPSRRVYLSDIHGVGEGPGSVLRNGVSIPERLSYDELRSNGDGYYYDHDKRRLVIQSPGSPDSTVTLLAENLVLLTVKEQTPSPHEFRLEPNYPNPFNPTTKIAFSVPVRGLVSLKVFDLLGKEVATLMEKVLAPGSYTVTFDGDGLASGVYICRLQSGPFHATAKLTLVK